MTGLQRVLGLQKGSHPSRAQWAHQVSASALFIRLKKAFEDYQHTTVGLHRMFLSY